MATALSLNKETLDATFGGDIFTATNNTYTVGTSSNKFKAVYATTFYGALSGNASTATTATYVANGGAGTANEARHVWFSNTSPETSRVYDDDFMYNPSTNTLTVGSITGNAATATTAAGISTSGVLTITAGSTTYMNRGSVTSLIFQLGGTEHARFDTDGHLIPATDSTYTIGNSSKYWKAVYADTFTGTTFTGGLNANGHIYLTGAVANSSTANSSQIIFGTSSDNHVAISSNRSAIIINPSSSSTENQIVLYTNGQPSVFPNGIQGNAATATKLATARTIRTNLGSTSTASFNGTANITPGVTGTLPIANGGTGATTAAGVLTNLGITATAAELNKMDGVTATTTELNYVDGVTSNIQTQLRGKQSSYIMSPRNCVNGTLITTNIDYSKTQGHSFLLEIIADTYGSFKPLFTQAQGYIYDNTIIHCGLINHGYPIPELYAINVEGVLCFWFPRLGYWQSFGCRVYTSDSDYTYNHIETVKDAAKPNGTKIVSLHNQKYDVMCFGDTATIATKAIKSAVTTTNPSSGTIYLLPFITGAGDVGLLANNGIGYWTKEGTTSSTGAGELKLGNNIASGTAGNKQGMIYMYGTSSGYTEIKPSNNTTNSVVIYLPSTAGTLALTSGSITGNAATATKATQDSNGNQINTTYLKLSGGTMTGNLTFATTKGIKYAAGDNDTQLWQVYDGSGAYGYALQYSGSGSGNNNDLVLISDNQSGTKINAVIMKQDGTTTFAKTITASGGVIGNASTATKLATARTISLTGSVTGSGSFDGSGNLSIATTTNHTHSYLPLSGGTITGNLTFMAHNQHDADQFIYFKYSTTDLDNYSWRLGYLGTGSGDTNYLAFQSNGSGAWANVLTLSLTSKKATFSGNVTATSFTENGTALSSKYAPIYTYSSTDPGAGSSLTTGKLYIVYS